MGVAGYLWERLSWCLFTVYLVYICRTNVSVFMYLTFWTMSLLICYLTIDKASPHVGFVTRVLHGMTFVGVWFVLMSWGFMAVVGTWHCGSFYEWECRIAAAAGGQCAEYWEHHVRKFVEHGLPPIVMSIDAWLSRDNLRRCYRGCSRLFRCVLAIASYLAFGVTWENSQQKAKNVDFFTSYQLPPWLNSSSLLDMLGLPPRDDLPDDKIFSESMKIFGLVSTLAMYMIMLGPLFSPAPKAKTR